MLYFNLVLKNLYLQTGKLKVNPIFNKMMFGAVAVSIAALFYQSSVTI